MWLAVDMSQNLVIDRQALSAFCRRHHIARLALFGSVLRDDFRADSDVDILVEFLPGHVPGLRFVTIERELSELLQGRRVDLVTPKFLTPRIRDRVLTAAETLYVAA
jgi:predicted nucleotidyltransferase